MRAAITLQEHARFLQHLCYFIACETNHTITQSRAQYCQVEVLNLNTDSVRTWPVDFSRFPHRVLPVSPVPVILPFVHGVLAAQQYAVGPRGIYALHPLEPTPHQRCLYSSTQSCPWVGSSCTFGQVGSWVSTGGMRKINLVYLLYIWSVGYSNNR